MGFALLLVFAGLQFSLVFHEFSILPRHIVPWISTHFQDEEQVQSPVVADGVKLGGVPLGRSLLASDATRAPSAKRPGVLLRQRARLPGLGGGRGDTLQLLPPPRPRKY